MTTTPFIDTVETSWRIALTAAASAPFLSPRPTHRPAPIAAASVTRTSSRARLRSGCSAATRRDTGTPATDMLRIVSVPWVLPALLQGHDRDFGRFDAHPDLIALAQPKVCDRCRRHFRDDRRRAITVH